MNQPPRDPADWSALQSLLEQALALPVSDRAVWLEALPPRHEPLREPLRRLLEVQAGLETRPFIDHASAGIEGLTPVAAVIIGDLIGPYRLLQELGDGGMGSVWLAERADGAMKRKVALKLPRMVWARDLATRMARERDILGSLEHPRIARLYDAGVDQLGRPFLALEYVEGERIDRYCDRQRLGVSQRIGLFLQVLEAVQYAHTNLVLHRDLKPANVLVNQRGEIRLLDFGIAKLLDERTSPERADAHSRSLSRAMTPRYASPEQVRQLRLSLASDVYSLGVMLHELLVGTTPYVTHNGSRAELEIAITEGRLRAPSRSAADAATAALRQSTPSRLARALRGELDAVLLKALARNPSERYPSAEALRADLERWLAGHPVHAKRPSRLLALRKFVTRNAWSVAVGGTAVCAVLTAGLIAIAQAREARLESRRATATRDFLLGLFENANPELHGGRELTARDLLLAGEASLDKSTSVDREIKADVYSGVANLWSRLGDRQRAYHATAKRVRMLESLGPSPSLVTALLDKAEASLQSGAMDDLKSATDQLHDVSRKASLTDAQLSELRYYEGWRLLRSGSVRASKQAFTAAKDFAARVSDLDRSLRALSGRIQAHAAEKNPAAALEDYTLAIDILKDSGLSDEDRLRRAVEVVAPLYSLGEYRLGWPLISALAEESSAVLGEFSETQSALRLYWGRWSVQVGKPKDALAWLQGRSGRQLGSTSAPGGIESFDYLALETELLLASGRVKESRQALERLKSYGSQVSIGKKRLLSTIRLDLLIKENNGQGMVHELSGPVWRGVEKTSDESRWEFHKLWYQSLAHILLGEKLEALASLSTAESVAVRSWGASHPRTRTAQFLRLSLLASETDMSTESRNAALGRLQHLQDLLRESYPDTHPLVSKADDIVSSLESRRLAWPAAEKPKSPQLFVLH